MSEKPKTPSATTAAKIPRRQLHASRLPPSVSIVGLGCSSFSTFFWTPEERTLLQKDATWSAETLKQSHPRVQEWIQTIHYAILEAGITLLDTAPWYGHGTSEIVIGWALQQLAQNAEFSRSNIVINTKVGRYDADPSRQFDFSREATVSSAQRSVRRLHCDYIDVLQLHDPEFAPSLDQLLEETIPAMMECRRGGLCRALGMTGYPLAVQHLILQRSWEEFGENIWDQALTYSHFNLHDTSLLTRSTVWPHASSFLNYARESNMEVLAAAPLSMGLLTHRGPPEWHPAPPQLKQACREAAAYCQDHGVDISALALLFALSEPRIPCTILGMKDVNEVRSVQRIAQRVGNVKEQSQDDILEVVLSETELRALDHLRDIFARVDGRNEWDGVAQAWEFWEQQGKTDLDKWQTSKKL